MNYFKTVNLTMSDVQSQVSSKEIITNVFQISVREVGKQFQTLTPQPNHLRLDLSQLRQFTLRPKINE